MMKRNLLPLVIILFLLTSTALQTRAQNKTFIPDTNFRNFLVTNYPTYMDLSGDSLLIDSASKVTGSFACPGQNISDLTGLEHFVNVQWLYVYNNNLTSLPDISAMTSLKWLHCYNNQLTSLPPLSTFPGLSQLYCENNKLTSIPDLSNNMLLQRIYCEYNELDSLPDLSNIFMLNRLYCHNNNLTKLPSLSNNSLLQRLWCTNNFLTQLPSLSNNTNLVLLSCDQNQLTSLPDLSNCTLLQDVYCYSNQLTALPDLSSNTNLVNLACNNNQLTALPDMTNNVNLVLFFCANNKLDFSDAKALRIINTLASIGNFSYAPQRPFGVSETHDLCIGDSLILSISAQDSAISYQWYKDGIAMPGKTDTALVLTNVTLADSATYTCRSFGTALNTPPMSFDAGISQFISEPVFVAVHNYPTVSFLPFSLICQNENSFDLTEATPAGGTYSGNGVSSNKFYAAIADTGISTIYYSYTDSNGCGTLDSQNIVVNPVFSTSLPNQEICGGDSINLWGSYQDTAGSYEITLSSVQNGCDSIVTIELAVNPSYYVTDSLLSICFGDSILIYSEVRTTPGMYYDTLLSVKGCDSIHTVELVVDSLPNVTATASDSVVCSISDAVFLIGMPSGGTFFGDSVLNSFISDTQFIPYISDLGVHDLTYAYTDSNGCADVAHLSIVVEPCGGIEESNSTTLRVYPNPGNGLFSLSVELQNPVSHLVIGVRNALGQKVRNSVCSPGERHFNTSIDLRNEPRGVYLLELDTGKQRIYQKILVH